MVKTAGMGDTISGTGFIYHEPKRWLKIIKYWNYKKEMGGKFIDDKLFLGTESEIIKPEFPNSLSV